MKKVVIHIILLCIAGKLFAQDSSFVCKNAVNSTVTLLTDSVTGSGFFIDDSIIAANYHSVKKSSKIYYSTNNSSVKYAIEGYIAVDATFDLILLKASGQSKPPVKITGSQSEVGQKVYAISGACGKSSCISGGNVLAKLGLNGDTLIQISTSVNDKGSGGPVLNSLGELVGISVKHIVNGHDLYISIPAKYLERMLKNRSDSPVPLSQLSVHANTPVQAAKTYFRDGLQKFVYQDYKGALQDFNNSINLNPNDTDIYEFLGITRFLMNDNLGAIKAFTQLLLITPNNEDAYYHRGAARRKIEDYTEAINDFDSVIKLDPTYAEAYLSRGLAEVGVKNYEDAEQDITQAIDLNVTYSDSYISNALIQEKAQHYKAAIQDLTTCLSDNPNEFIAYLLRGYAKYRLENLNASGIGPSLDDYRLGLIHCSTHDINESFYYGLAKYKLGDYKVSLQYFNSAIANDQFYTDAYFYRGLVYSKILDYQNALKDFSMAIKLNPKNGEYYYHSGFVKLQSGDKDGACIDFKKAMQFGNLEAQQSIDKSCK